MNRAKKFFLGFLVSPVGVRKEDGDDDGAAEGDGESDITPTVPTVVGCAVDNGGEMGEHSRV